MRLNPGEFGEIEVSEPIELSDTPLQSAKNANTKVIYALNEY